MVLISQMDGKQEGYTVAKYHECVNVKSIQAQKGKIGSTVFHCH